MDASAVNEHRLLHLKDRGLHESRFQVPRMHRVSSVTTDLHNICIWIKRHVLAYFLHH